MQLYFLFNTRQQSHKSLSKMLIEHTSRSTEDKPETDKCVGVLRRSTGCFNQQSLNWSANQQCHTTLRSTKQSTLPRKFNVVQQKVKVNATWSTVNLWPWFLCQNVWTAEIEVYAKIQLLLTMHWQKSTLVKPAVETLAAAENVFVLLPRVNHKFDSK